MKIKLVTQIIVFFCLVFSTISYGSSQIICAMLKISEAYQNGNMTEERLQELFNLWKDDLNAISRDYYYKDFILSYNDFKKIFILEKEHIRTIYPLCNGNNFDTKLEEILTDNNLIRLFLKDINNIDRLNGLFWTYFHYYKYDDLDKIINEMTIGLQEYTEH